MVYGTGALPPNNHHLSIWYVAHILQNIVTEANSRDENTNIVSFFFLSLSLFVSFHRLKYN